MKPTDLPESPVIHSDHSGNTAPGGTRSPDPPEALWRRAQRRALTYMQVMGAPTLEGHELVMEALKRAYQTIQGAGRGEPVKETMQVLRRLLNDAGIFTHSGPQYGRWFKYRSLRRQVSRAERDISGGMASMPAVNRGAMSTDRK